MWAGGRSDRKSESCGPPAELLYACHVLPPSHTDTQGRTLCKILNSTWPKSKDMDWHFLKYDFLTPRDGECKPTIPALTDLFKVLCAAGWYFLGGVACWRYMEYMELEFTVCGPFLGDCGLDPLSARKGLMATVSGSSGLLSPAGKAGSPAGGYVGLGGTEILC